MTHAAIRLCTHVQMQHNAAFYKADTTMFLTALIGVNCFFEIVNEVSGDINAYQILTKY